MTLGKGADCRYPLAGTLDGFDEYDYNLEMI